MTFSQEKYSVTGKIIIEHGTLENTIITIYKNAEKADAKMIENSGKFNYDLEFGNDYIFEFSKEGFVTKKVSISTFVPIEVLSRDSQFPPFKFKISLFPAYKGLDLSIFDQPMGMIMYDKELDDFDYDRDYDSQIRDAIKRAEEEARKRAAELEAQRLAREKAYKDAIQKGDINFRGKKYEESKLAYNEALAIKSEEAYPKAQIAKIDALLAGEQAKADEAARLAAEKKAIDEKYAAIIALADSQFTAGDYATSKISYTDALEIKAEEIYPKSQIAKIDELLVEQQRQSDEAARLAAEKQALDEKYTALITSADSQFEAKDYTNSKSNYTEALVLKAEEVYPKSQIAKIDDLLAEQQRKADEAARLVAEKQALDEKYAALIASADSQFEAKDYTNSRSNYSDASALKTEEAYPKSQISKIDELLTEQQRQADEAARLASEKKALDEKYTALIASADSQFEAKDYTNSKSNYTEALALKVEEVYPKSQISKIDELLTEQQRQADEAARLASEKKALDEKYTALIASADSQFEAKDYTNSKSNYTEALALKAEEVYPKSQISKIDELLAEQQRQSDEAARLAAEKQALDEKYTALIASADSQFEAKDYTNSKSNYTEALALKAEEVYPKSQISKIDELLAEQQRKADEADRLASAKKALDEKYTVLIASADSQFEAKDYTNSKSNYTEALALKAEEVYPKSQIAKINELISEQQRQADEASRLASEKQALDEKYATLIASADSQFQTKDYTNSRSNYIDALALKAEEVYPKSQIAKIDDLLAEQQRQADEAARLAAEKQALDEKYADLIASADTQFEAKDYTISKSNYTDALALKAEETYPKSQIAKIDALLADQQKQADEAARLAAEKQALDEKYVALIASADSQFEAKDYTNSKSNYTEALALKAEEVYPKSQIAKIDNLLSEQQRQADEAARLASEKQALDEKHAALIASADSQFEEKNYTNAKAKYREALSLKSNESYPKSQISKIDELLGELQRQADEKAKLLAEQKANDAKYLSLIQSADKFFESERWQSSAQDYRGALELKPEERYPKGKLEEIDEILAEIERKNKEKLTLKYQYAELIKEADERFTSEEYNLAIGKYEEALSLKPKETYPTKQIKRIEVILERLALAERKQKELDQKYSEELEKAEEFFSDEKFSVARHHYKAALEIKPKEEYPKEKLAEIKKRLEALKISEQEAIANNPTNFENKLSIKKEREYANIIAKGDESFKSNQYTVAKVMYERALNLFEREYPKKQLKEINKLIRDGKYSILSEEYRKLIAQGDKELAADHYSVAKFYYKKAIRLNSLEKYPKTQLDKIDELVNSKKNQKIDKEYNDLIDKADDAFDKGSLTVARFYYQKASKLKSKEKYPKEKLKMIQTKQSKK
ncbi:hypothetical protein GCQ56_03750 [Marinifilum sp. N1E240]|uniref:hypothetical protein n=1 Tax=Marinifilum sp. N1E240 TaxID=2608082 RepID=UPI00128B1C20|nr:hypothetical protein [Marinifilum sp. N1E240]MPQ46115.1 hypothetical protein [Marinifilum sp. N1E240]